MERKKKKGTEEAGNKTHERMRVALKTRNLITIIFSVP